MEKKELIEFLKKSLKEIPRLKKLSPGNQDVIIWRDSIEDVLKEVCGQDSDEYTRFHKTRMKWSRKLTGAQRQHQYARQLRTRQTVIRSITKKIETLGIKEKPKTQMELKDTPKSPTQLFDAMQFHPKVVEASRELFKDEHYAQAIFEAFKAVENFVQDKSGENLYGSNLMEKVFSEENPIIKVPEAGYYYKDVQRGFRHLFVGATQAIRNPKAHKGIVQRDPYITLHYLGFASFLLKRIDYWEASVS